jgi:serine/threonine-protein kinase ULK/ATG1
VDTITRCNLLTRISCLEPLPDPVKFAPRSSEDDRTAQKRRLADQEAESNAVTAVAVYMLVMTFAHKGIDQLRRHQEHVSMRDPGGEFIVSPGFDEGEPVCIKTETNLTSLQP